MSESAFIKALRGERPTYIPVWFMRQAGRFLPEYRSIRSKFKDFFEMCRNVETSIEVTALPVKLLGVDAAILFSDLLVPLLPFKSMSVALKEHVGPVIETNVPLTEPEKLLHPYNVKEELSFVAEIVKGFKKAFPDVPLIGFCGAPFTLLSYIIEGGGSKNYHKTKRFMFEHPQAFNELSNRIVDILIEYGTMQLEAGADAFQVFDSWAGALSPEHYQRFIFQPTQRLIEGLKKTGKPVIYFSTGTCGSLPIIKDYPCDAVSVDWRISLKDAISAIGKEKTVQGNLDPSALFLSLDELKKEAIRIINEGKKAKAHIFNLGHGVFPDTNPDKVKWLVELIHSTPPE